MYQHIPWPDGKQFAFTVFDDTDAATVENVAPVYRFLQDLGFHTTKACWSLRGDAERGKFPGETLEDENYRNWLIELQQQNFELGWHGVTWHSSSRNQILRGLNCFNEVFHHFPSLATNHTGNLDAMYWGYDRLSSWLRPAYHFLTRFRNRNISRGHIDDSEFFWGDLCQKHIKYYRNFVFQDANSLKSCPFMPYHDPKRPFVNYWFASSDGHDVAAFNRCLSEANQDRLEREGGACIMYTHFAKGFVENGKLDPRFQSLMTRLAKKNGWFVPVSTLLDHLLAVRGRHVITDAERRRLEWKWLREKIFIGTT